MSGGYHTTLKEISTLKHEFPSCRENTRKPSKKLKRSNRNFPTIGRISHDPRRDFNAMPNAALADGIGSKHSVTTTHLTTRRTSELK